MSNTPQVFDMPDINRPEHAALKALEKGEATPHEQRLALSVIVKKLSRAHDLPYIPGSFDGTAFLTGRQFVGKKLLYYLNSPVSESPEVPNDG